MSLMLLGRPSYRTVSHASHPRYVASCQDRWMMSNKAEGGPTSLVVIRLCARDREKSLTSNEASPRSDKKCDGGENPKVDWAPRGWLLSQIMSATSSGKGIEGSAYTPLRIDVWLEHPHPRPTLVKGERQKERGLSESNKNATVLLYTPEVNPIKTAFRSPALRDLVGLF